MNIITYSLIIFLLLAVCYFSYLFYCYIYYKKLNAPLVFSLCPWVMHNYLYSKNCLNYLRNCRQQYGDNFTLFLAKRFVTVVTNPNDYKYFHHLNAKKIIDNEIVFKEIGVNLTGSNHTFAQMSLFDRDRIYIDEFSNENYDNNLINLKQSYKKYINNFFNKKYTGANNKLYLFDFVEELLFYVGTDMLIAEDFINEPDTLNDYRKVEKQFPWIVAGMPVEFIPELYAALKNMKKNSWKILKNKKACPFMKKLYEFDKKKYNTSMEEEAGMNIGTLWAALTTTTAAAFWFIYYVFSNPKLCQELVIEIKRELKLNNLAEVLDGTFTAEEFKNLKLLRSCLDEILRITSNTLSYRRVMQDLRCELPSGNILNFQPGDYLSMLPMLMHYDESIFKNATQFNPYRFLNDPKFYYQGEYLPIPLMPFGGGRGICPGRNLAIRELKMLIIVLLSFFKINIPENAKPEFNYFRSGLGIFPPKDDIEFSISFEYEKADPQLERVSPPVVSLRRQLPPFDTKGG